MIAVVDYGVGNLFSLVSSLERIGHRGKVTSDISEIMSAGAIILPGVGAFRDAAKKLEDSGIGDALKKAAKDGVPLLGICLGAQLLTDKSFEFGEYTGLGLIPGKVLPLKDYARGLKIPHMGWNSLDLKAESKLFTHINCGDFVYFVHSYFISAGSEYVSSTARYGIDVTASIECGNVYGTQFHPEKSGEVGLKILKAFCELEKS
ncbi:MAG: imidazole glycerol phosphate synthase subunit HisH [Clostridia bacterium]|nr:imidazole glycerol phosphate synthase subunit HisH [Clostridia bacterium]